MRPAPPFVCLPFIIYSLKMQFSNILAAAAVVAVAQAANNSSSSSSSGAGAVAADGAIVGAGLAVAGAVALLL